MDARIFQLKSPLSDKLYIGITPDDPETVKLKLLNRPPLVLQPIIDCGDVQVTVLETARFNTMKSYQLGLWKWKVKLWNNCVNRKKPKIIKDMERRKYPRTPATAEQKHRDKETLAAIVSKDPWGVIGSNITSSNLQEIKPLEQVGHYGLMHGVPIEINKNIWNTTQSEISEPLSNNK